ncbi:MAG: hypothetical protein Q9165_003053 [Trypethelium subeluteriae]
MDLSINLQGPPTWLYVRSSATDSEPTQKLSKRPLDVSEQSAGFFLGKSTAQIAETFAVRAACAFGGCVPLPTGLDKKKDITQTKLTSNRGIHKKHKATYQESLSSTAPDTMPVLQDNVATHEIEDSAKSLLCDRDLCKSGNICEYLQQQCYQGKEQCLGYLSSAKPFKHVIYAASRRSNDTGGSALESSITLLDLLEQATDDTMTIVDQLRIAHKLAIAVLQFGFTPWLRDHWELQHLALFRIPNDTFESALGTLHLSARFPKFENEKREQTPGSEVPRDHTMGSDSGSGQREQDITSSSHDTLLYGVDNAMLCSLGIALLQISHRKPLESLQQRQDPNNLYTARRLAKHGTARLGPKYKAIVQQCLSCDFRSGSDLKKPELQMAVYADVVCGLQEIIQGLGDISI